jgi:hypothetical protein
VLWLVLGLARRGKWAPAKAIRPMASRRTQEIFKLGIMPPLFLIWRTVALSLSLGIVPRPVPHKMKLKCAPVGYILATIYYAAARFY